MNNKPDDPRFPFDSAREYHEAYAQYQEALILEMRMIEEEIDRVVDKSDAARLRRRQMQLLTMLDQINHAFIAETQKVLPLAQKTQDQAIITPQPPKHAEHLLWYLPEASREYVIGDLEEDYGKMYRKFGRRSADRWYYTQVIVSFWPFIAGKVGGLIRLAGQGSVIELIRRLIS